MLYAPEPWHCQVKPAADNVCGRITVVDSTGGLIFKDTLYGGDEDAASDAVVIRTGRLISATPDLLAACKLAEEFIRTIGAPCPPHPWRQLVNAIAKAEGQP